MDSTCTLELGALNLTCKTRDTGVDPDSMVRHSELGFGLVLDGLGTRVDSDTEPIDTGLNSSSMAWDSSVDLDLTAWEPALDSDS